MAAASEHVAATGFNLFLAQMWVMMKKNFMLQIRYWKSTLAQVVLGPMIFLIVLAILQEGYASSLRSSARPSYEYPVIGVSKCTPVLTPNCISILYTPQNAFTTNVMKVLGKNNAARSGFELSVDETTVLSDPNQALTKSYDIVGASDTGFIYDFVYKNKNTTQFAVVFNTSVTGGVTNYRYQIWFNYTLTSNITAEAADAYSGIIPLMRALDEAIISVGDSSNVGRSTTLNTSLRDWPKVPPRVIPDAVVSQLGATFFYCSMMIVFISVLNNMVTEKEMHLKSHMEIVGLMSSVYWLSWTLNSIILVGIAATVTSVTGIILQFAAFKNCDYGVLWITFFLFGMAMVSLAYFIAAFCQKTRTAVLVGIFVFIIGLLFESFVFSNVFIGYVWFDEPFGQNYIILYFLPFFNFGKAFLDISTMTVGRLDALTETYIAGPGYSWSTLYETLPNNLLPPYSADGRRPKVPPTVDSWNFLIMNIFLYGLLAVYLDQVMPNEFGHRKPFFFFLKPQFWGYKSKEKPVIDKTPDATDEEEEADVRPERELVLNESNTKDYPLKIINLCKTYYPSIFRKDNGVLSVNRLCLALKEGQLLAFLGQNGAGKSTTINILSGLITATKGDALFFGQYFVSQDMDVIRQQMGVCPQHDVLFPDLTAKEHVELYAGLKGLDHNKISDMMMKRLETVSLASVANQVSRTFSGGMKRRLTLILSTIGDPQVLFLDEPTTGMDPLNRRHVWSFIENFKKNRVVILTSHSMEEVEVLGDRIGIMVKGKLRALGNPIQLRNRFGAGQYRISIICSVANAPEMKKQFSARLPDALLEDDSAGALLYQIPSKDMDQIPEVIAWLEENPDNLVRSWGMSQTTLEEVFLKIVRKYSGEIRDPHLAAKAEVLEKRSSGNLAKKTE